MNIILAILFACNATAHVISFRQLKARGGDNPEGVLVFGAVNAALGVLMAADVSWAQWPALIVPAIGGSALFATTIRPGNAQPIDNTILGLDIATIVLALISIFI